MSLQELKKDHQKTSAFVDKAQQSFDELMEGRKETASSLESKFKQFVRTGR